jgi:hypothetical protein
MKNLDALLMIMETKDPAVVLTIPRLCALSLVSVFQDILPSYPIKHTNPEGVKREFSNNRYETCIKDSCAYNFH